MSPHRFFPALVAAACVVAVAACAESTSEPTRIPPAAVTPPPPAPPSLVTLNGFVRAGGRSESGVILETTDGRAIHLGGDEVDRLVSVDGAEVEIRGTWDLVNALLVQDFLVQAVEGRAAMDGVLTAIYADDYFEDEVIGYGLRLTRSELLVPLTDPPADLLEHLGQRVWFTDASNGTPSAYGVIGRVAEKNNREAKPPARVW